MPNLLTTKEIAQLKNMKIGAVQKLIKRRKIPIAKVIGRSNLIDSKHLKMFDNRKSGNPHKTKR